MSFIIWQGFYDEIANVLLADVNFHYPDTVNSVTGSQFKQLFNGSEIVVAGRLNDIEMNDFPIEVAAQTVRDIKLLLQIILWKSESRSLQIHQVVTLGSTKWKYKFGRYCFDMIFGWFFFPD